MVTVLNSRESHIGRTESVRRSGRASQLPVRVRTVGKPYANH
jgi:hypothetical protein